MLIEYRGKREPITDGQLTPDPTLTLDQATDRADDVVDDCCPPPNGK